MRQHAKCGQAGLAFTMPTYNSSLASTTDASQGLTGYNWNTTMENLGPGYKVLTWFSF
jgi:hypothetical protein